MIGTIVDKVRTNRIAGGIMGLLSHIGADRILYAILYKWNEKHLTESMKESSQYFESREEDIDNNMMWLSDEKSKRIWKNMIELRKTMRYSLHPGKELPQYFVDDVISYGPHEVFVDCGGYDGMTSVEFIKHLKRMGGEYDKIVIFEPDVANMRLLKENLHNISNICVIQKGVWNKTTKIGFCGGQNSASKIIEESDAGIDEKCDTVEVVALDDIEECKKATFIKMDIEGAELMALKGAQNLIKTNKPKLAICIYHSDEDMIEIIKYIHQLVPEYKLYVRQHSDTWIETVLYACL